MGAVELLRVYFGLAFSDNDVRAANAWALVGCWSAARDSYPPP